MFPKKWKSKETLFPAPPKVNTFEQKKLKKHIYDSIISAIVNN